MHHVIHVQHLARKLAQQPAVTLVPLHHADLAAKNAVTMVVVAAMLARKNVLGGKFLKTKLAATNATMNVTAATAQKELTGTNSGLTDA